MIDWISNWAGAIIVAVIIGTIIEMILPEGNSKKYIKVVVGVYILFTITSPIINKITGKTLEVSELIDLNKYIEEVKEKEKEQNIIASSNEENIRDIYLTNLKKDIKSKVIAKGYQVNQVEIQVENDENYTLKKIDLDVSLLEDDEEEKDNQNVVNVVEVVNEINIQVSKSDSNSETGTNTINEKKEDKKKLSNSEQKKLKEYLSNVYEIKEKDINIS